jgi:hypothetical protein
VTPEQEALFGLVRLLERLGIRYMVSGSVASSYHGRPRSTHDADLVVEPTSEQLDLARRRRVRHFPGAKL